MTPMMLTDLWQPGPAFPDASPADPPRAELLELPMEPWAVERITDADAFEALRPEWEELLEASPSRCLFLTWEWLFTWWKHLARGRRLALLAVRRGGQLVALAPFARGTSRPAGAVGRHLLPTSLQLLGTGQVGSDYLDLLVRAGRERPAAEALAEHLAEEGTVVELRQLCAERSLAHGLAESLAERGWRAVTDRTHVCPVIDLAGLSWEDYVSSLGKSHRANLRRRFRKLEAAFDVRFERAGSELEVDEAFDLLLDLHRKRWRDRGGSDALSDPAVVAFHREVTRLTLRRGWLRLYVLRLDGRPAAALYGFHYRDRFLYYQSGFDAEFGDYSVGLVIMGMAIREAIAEGAREYDLLHGDESYKYLWASRTRELARVELYPPTLEGHLRRRTRGALRGTKARLRAWRERGGGEEG